VKFTNSLISRIVHWVQNIALERFILILALVNGLLYLALVPPWQHYDEPTHFEYAWLIASRGRLPRPGDYDQDMRREVAASMIEHHFFRGLNFTPNFLSQDKPIWLGVSELGHPPFYYLLVAFPLKWISHSDITFQLYIARSVSLLLYLLSIWLAGRVMAELLPQDHVLRWAVPGMMALLPAYTDLMTAVNNDVGGVVVFSFFLWGAVRMIHRGFSWARLIWLILAAVLCLWTKNTVAIAVLLIPVVLALTMFRGSRQRWAWLALGGWILGLLAALVEWGDAAFWYRQTDQERPTREVRAEAPWGKAALAIEMTPEKPGRSLRQPLLRANVEALRGREVTLGAWIWASEPVQIRSPILSDGTQNIWRSLDIGVAPAFYVVTGTVALNVESLQVVLQPLLDRTLKTTVTVYYDGLVLAEGIRPADPSPVFDDPDGQVGVWEGKPFMNRLRNGSAEAAWPRVRRWVEQGLSRYVRVPMAPGPFLASLLDVQWSGWVYLPTARTLLRSFWAYFGWGHVQLASPWYWLLEGLTVIGMGSALVGGIRRWRGLSQPARATVALFLLAGLWFWLSALLRVLPYLLERPLPLMPVARYTFPGIISTTFGLTWGWLQVAPPDGKQRVAVFLMGAMAVLNGVSLFTIVRFYQF